MMNEDNDDTDMNHHETYEEKLARWKEGWHREWDLEDYGEEWK